MVAIVYSSKSGHTYKYANELASRLSLPLLTIRKARRVLKKNDEIIFMSWVCEDRIVGYEKLAKFVVKCVVAVGILPQSSEVEVELRHHNFISSKLFYLRGGINKKKLSLRQRITLNVIKNSLIFEKSDSGLTKAKDSALEAIINDLDYTDLDDLLPIIEYVGCFDQYVS